MRTKEEITFYDPKPTMSLLCRVGIHRPTILAAEGPINHGWSYVWRWTCSCQGFYWLNDQEALRDGLALHGGVKFSNR